jgi:O-antigen ligase/Tfp pilus assembly protein PilF
MSPEKVLVAMIVAVGLGYTVFMPSAKQLMLDLGVTALVLVSLSRGGAGSLKRLLAGRLAGPALALLAAGLLSLARAPHLPSGARALYHVGVFLALERIVASVLGADERRRALLVLLGVGAASAALAIGQVALPGLAFPWPTGGRAVGTMGNPNFLGSVLAGLLPVALGAWRAWPPLTLTRLALGAAIPVLALGLFASVTRGALLGVAGGLVAFVLLDRREPSGTAMAGASGGAGAPRRAVVAALVLAAGAWLLLHLRGLDLFAVLISTIDVEHPTNRQRLTWWRESLALFLRQPLHGIGLGNFIEAHPRVNTFGDRPVMEARLLEHAHNDYLHLLAETGLAGAVAFLWLGWRAVRLARTALGHQPEAEARAMVAGLCGGLAALAIHAAFVTVLFQPASGLVFWTLLGLLEAAGQGLLDAGSAPAPTAGRTPAAARESTTGGPAAIASRPGLVGAGIVLAALFVWLSGRPSAGEYFYQRAAVAIQTGDAERGVRYARRSARWDPDRVEPRFTLATYHAARREFDAARGQIESALARHPTYLMGYTLLADLEQGAGRPAAAAAAYARALAINPAYSPALTRLAALHVAAGDTDQARPLIARARALYPDLATPYLLEARLAEAQGDRRAALAAARAATAAAPRDGEAWFQRARLAELLGHSAEAWDALGRAVGLDRRIGVAAATDPAFAKYLDQPAFRALVGLVGIVPAPSPSGR